MFIRCNIMYTTRNNSNITCINTDRGNGVLAGFGTNMSHTCTCRGTTLKGTRISTRFASYHLFMDSN